MGWLSAGLSDSLKACLLAISGEGLLHSTAKVARKVLGDCLLPRQVIGGLITLSQIDSVELPLCVDRGLEWGKMVDL